ncbi:hypothetical protein DNTS_034817 [Danionella cerebrum]|uniref:Uncharacterized protein n=1 Tax=Danionella cerebrum TaxID=2873325 RepID=A0A553R9Z5_9TELE|nr:hypothetical protein DNTS_034817 [Danionella translucida]
MPRASPGKAESEPLSKQAQTLTSPGDSQAEIVGIAETREGSPPPKISVENDKMEVQAEDPEFKQEERNEETDEGVEKKKRKIAALSETEASTKSSDESRDKNTNNLKVENTKHSQQSPFLKTGTDESKSYAAVAAKEKAQPSKVQRNQESTTEIERFLEPPSSSSLFKFAALVFKSACKVAQLLTHYTIMVLSLQLLLKIADILHETNSECGEELKQELSSKIKSIQEDFSKWRNGLLSSRPMLSSGFRFSKEIQISDVDKIAVYFLETPAKAIQGSHPRIQSCFLEMCGAAIKNQCQIRKEGDLLRCIFKNTISWPVMSSIIVESAARFGENHESRLLDPQSAINFLLSQDEWSQWNLDGDANRVVTQSQLFLGWLIRTLCEGNIPMGNLKNVLKHKTLFQRLFNQYKNNKNQENISISVSELLSQREKDMNALEQQKEYITNVINMVGKISDVINDGLATFKEVDQALMWTAGKGEGDRLKKELSLMASLLKSSIPDESWAERRLIQIQKYRLIYQAAESAENDADIDRLASFETAIMGYGPLLYSLPKDAGFEVFMDCTKPVWDTLDKDEKLLEKLVDSTRWLDWLKGLRETHGSVEQSSLSLTTAINTGGVYHVGWPEDFNKKVSRQV